MLNALVVFVNVLRGCAYCSGNRTQYRLWGPHVSWCCCPMKLTSKAKAGICLAFVSLLSSAHIGCKLTVTVIISLLMGWYSLGRFDSVVSHEFHIWRNMDVVT